MTRILLACGIGASTGFMAANMRKAAKAQGLDVSIHAVSKSQVPEYADKIDVLLLGPHFSAEVPKYKEMLDNHGIRWEEGQHTEADILNADEIVKSPGIPDKAPIIQLLKKQGTPIISEIEFAGRYTDSKRRFR